ncbi:hypothetical protein F5Y03DRAFT_206102 [Xylaria venustula]|nr:hypothetical protein F5Y03DRAFT_206102 [Xylaria venustula]
MSPVADNTSYAPKSPDLSSLYSGPEFHQAYYKPNSYASSNSTSGGNYSLQPPAQAQAQTRVQQLQPGTHNFDQPQVHHQYPAHHYHDNSNIHSSSGTSNGSLATPTVTNHDAYHLHPHQHVPLSPYPGSNSHHALSPYPHQPDTRYYPPPAPQHQQQQQQHQQYPPQSHLSYHPLYYSSFADPPTSTSYSPTKQHSAQQQHLHVQPQLQPQQQPHLAFNRPTTSTPPDTMPRGKAAAQIAREPEVMESPVRTKFPTARIKRIMQADEEVGKVAQQTPIAVGKALELFMVQLVHKSAEVAKEKNSKRITAPMLKQAIDSTNEWDFLREIVSKVTEEKEGARSGRPKAESDSDDDVDVGEVKRRGRGGRKKKAAA